MRSAGALMVAVTARISLVMTGSSRMRNGPGKAEGGEQAFVAEPGERRDALSGDRHHEEPSCTMDVCVGIRSVVTERRRVVGSGRDHSDVLAPDPAKELRDGARPPELERLGGHRHPCIVGEEGDDLFEVSPLECFDEALDDLGLAGGSGKVRLIAVAGGLEARTRPLERTVYRGGGGAKHVGDLVS